MNRAAACRRGNEARLIPRNRGDRSAPLDGRIEADALAVDPWARPGGGRDGRDVATVR
jgi:hypothetical protein